MRTATQEVKQETKKDLKEAFVLWKNKGTNSEYLSGFTTFDENKKVKLIGFINSTKKNPNEPDFRIYYTDEKGAKTDLAVSLWENVGKNDSRYLTGSTSDDEKIVAFYGKEHQEARPFIRAYFKD